MLCIRANLTAGPDHSKYQAGESVAAVLFAAADTIEAAESLLMLILSAQGWARIATERYKEVASAEEVGDSLLQEAFREAVSTGVGYVLFPG